MNEFVIKIQAPELAKAIGLLAEALSGRNAVTIGEIAAVNGAPKEEVKEAPKVVEKKVEIKESPKAVQEEPKEESKFTEVEVRAKFVELAQAGKRTELKKMLDDFGVAKVSELKEDQYEEAMAKLGEM